MEKMIFVINRGKESEETKNLPHNGKFFVIYTLQVQKNSIEYG